MAQQASGHNLYSGAVLSNSNSNPNANMRGNPGQPSSSFASASSISPSYPPIPPKPVEIPPELAQLKKQELEELLNDDEKFEKFLLGLEKHKNIETIVKELRDENDRVAASTLEKQKDLGVLRENLAIQQDIFKVKQSELDESAKKLGEVMKKYSASVIMGKLASESRKGEEESEEVAQRFMSGEIEVNEFVKSFIESRKKYHKRSAKLEMLQADPSILSQRS